MDSNTIKVMFFWCKEILGSVGVAIIVIGAVTSMHATWQAMVKKVQPLAFNEIRKMFACYIVLGLEFLLASDIVMTIMAPDYYTLGLLGGLVIVRTVMSLSLDKDIRS